MIVVTSAVVSAGGGEDRVATARLGDALFIVLADGAGGMGGGAQAAEFVCNAAVKRFRDRNGSADRWDVWLEQVDAMIATFCDGAMSTAVVVEIVGGEVFGASAGDSGAWMVGPESIVDLTEHQFAKPLLGSGEAIPLAFGPVRFCGRLLIASDGLFKYAPRARLAEAAVHGELDSAITSLVEAVRLKSGLLQDDVAVVLCEATS